MNPADIFVNSSGKIYWYESGMIRTLDSNGNVLTVAGQNTFYGDGLAAINARFGALSSLVIKSNGNVVVFDKTNIRIRELDRNTGLMNLLAGNNQNVTANTTALANSQSISRDIWVNTDNISILPATDEVLYSRGNYVSKISASTGKWVDLAGGGNSTTYTTADGLGLGNVKMYVNYYPKVLGATSSSILVGLGGWSGTTYAHGMLKTYDISTGIQSGFAGITGTNSSSSWPADGSVLSSTLVPHSTNHYPMSYDSVTGNWLTVTASNTVRTLTPGGNIGTLFTDTGTTAIRAMAFSRSSGNLIVYYCALVGSNYQIKKWEQANSTISTITWPSTSIACQSSSMAYDAANSRLIFSVLTNGLWGIAEYLNP